MLMNINILLILVLIGLVTGALGGMLGIGGGLILIPALVYFLGFSQHQAIGTSLAVMLPPIGLFAAYNYYKAGQANLLYALVLAIAFSMVWQQNQKNRMHFPCHNRLTQPQHFIMPELGERK